MDINNYDSISWITKELEDNGFAMTKKFGQNFLVNKHVREKIVSSLNLEKGSVVWEVGPGLGSLTSLLYKSYDTTCFEIDRGFCTLLRKYYNDSITLIEGDALKTMDKQVLKVKKIDALVSNLPYSTGSLILAHIIENSYPVNKMILMFQKEVVSRITSTVGDKNYGSFSILCNIDYKVRPLFDVSPQLFYPQPNVISSVALFEKREKSLVNNKKEFIKLIRDSFAQRRKTLKNNLYSNTYYDKTIIDKALDICLLNEKTRAQELSIEVFNKLNDTLLELNKTSCKSSL